MSSKENSKVYPNFFCESDVLNTILGMDFDEEEYGDLDLALNIVELPYTFFFTAKENEWILKVNERSELYSHDPDSGIEKAILTVDRATGQATGNTTEKVLNENIAAFFALCRNLSYYVQKENMQPLYASLDPDEAGIMLTDEDGELKYRVVEGKDRPALMCQTLFGGVQMGRPYMDDFMENSLKELMSDDEKEEAAENGDEEMMSQLADKYLNGDDDTEPDPEKAVYWYRKMAEAGNSVGMFNLGLHYSKGFGVERDFDQAIYWLEQAKENGDDDAEHLIEVLRRIIENLEKAENGDAKAQGELAGDFMNLGGSLDQAGSDADYAESIKWAKKGTAQGDGLAIWTLALAYQHGRGVEEDVEKAIRLFQKGADLGNDRCQQNLGCYYMNGEFVEKDEKKAFELFLKSAEQGCKLAMNNLAQCYYYGQGTERDLDKAMEWAQKAKEDEDEDEEEPKDFLEDEDIDALMQGVQDGDKDAIIKYGLACLLGSEYVQDSPEHGEEMLRELAEKGDPESQYSLAAYFSNNAEDEDGMHPEIMIKAIKYYAMMGDALFENGTLAEEMAKCFSWMPDLKNPFDSDLAIFWYKVAADLGSESAEQIYGMLTYARDHMAEDGFDDTKEYLSYLNNENKIMDMMEYHPEYTPTKEEYEKLYADFCRKNM